MIIEDLDAAVWRLWLKVRRKLRTCPSYPIHRPNTWRPKKMSRDEAKQASARFFAKLTQLRLEYPVIELRPAINRVFQLLNEGDITLVHSRVYHPQRRPTLSPALTVGKTPEFTGLVFWAPVWRDHELAIRHSLPAEFADCCFDDLVVLCALHEEYHLTEQLAHRPPRRGDAQAVVDDETACWAQTCAEVIQPMMVHGRAPLLLSRNGDLLHRHTNAMFAAIGHDPQSRLWRRFIELQYLRDQAPPT